MQINEQCHIQKNNGKHKKQNGGKTNHQRKRLFKMYIKNQNTCSTKHLKIIQLQYVKANLPENLTNLHIMEYVYQT